MNKRIETEIKTDNADFHFLLNSFVISSPFNKVCKSRLESIQNSLLPKQLVTMT